MSDVARSWSFREGDWYGVFGPRATVLLPPAQRARAATLWQLVDDGADFEETLDALVADGVRDLSDFVLLSAVGDRVRLVVRGLVRAHLATGTGVVHVEGDPSRIWVEQRVTEVSRIRLEVGPEAGFAAHAGDGDADLGDDGGRLERGLVRLSAAEHPPVRPEADLEESAAESPAYGGGSHVAPQVAPQADPAVEPPLGPATVAVPRSVVPPAGPPSGPPPGPPSAPPAGPPPAPPAPPAPAAQPVVDPLGDPLTDLLDDLLGVPYPEPDDAEPGDTEPDDTESDDAEPIHAAPEADHGEADRDETDHDGLTRPPTAPPPPPPPPPGIAGQPPAPPVTARPVAALRLPDGETVPVDRTVLIGRAPEPARATTSDAPRLVPVLSPHQEVSATHIEIRPGVGADHGAAIVTDLGSTNGTVVAQPGLPAEELRPGVAVQLVPGAVIDLGDGVSIQVVEP